MATRLTNWRWWRLHRSEVAVASLYNAYISIYLMVYSLHHNVLPTLQSIPSRTDGLLYLPIFTNLLQTPCKKRVTYLNQDNKSHRLLPVLTQPQWDQCIITFTTINWQKSNSTLTIQVNQIVNWLLLGLFQFVNSRLMSDNMRFLFSTESFHFIGGSNSLWPSDAIWLHRYYSTLVQAMAWCIQTPSHCLSQCWLIVNKIQTLLQLSPLCQQRLSLEMKF